MTAPSQRRWAQRRWAPRHGGRAAPPETPDVDPRLAGAAARAMVRPGADAVLVGEEGRLVRIVTATDLLVSLAGGRPGSSAGGVR